VSATARAIAKPIVYPSRMAAIGVTGGIGSGKSTFCRMLAPLLHAETFDADAAAKKFLSGDPAVKNEVTAALGASCFLADGTPDRAAIRAKIFSDSVAKRLLEEILHPRVRAEWTRLAEAARAENKHFLADIPLLFETGAEKHLDFVVAVACSPETQLKRVTSRGLSTAEAQPVIASQMPLAEKVQRANSVAWNDGSLETLQAQAALLARRLA